MKNANPDSTSRYKKLTYEVCEISSKILQKDQWGRARARIPQLGVNATRYVLGPETTIYNIYNVVTFTCA